MKYTISKNLLGMFSKSDKNFNYMLDYLLSASDPHYCKDYFAILKKMDFDDEKIAIEISDSNIKYIKSLFGNITNELVERLIWVSLLFQEV